MDGIINVNKPKNYTSHDIVNIARKALGTKRIGHIGTLDPNATGVLVLCVNKATKLVKYFESHDKTYIATIRLGVKTDTDDLTGKILEEKDVSNLNEKKVYDTLMSFLGKQKQIPPKYSAIKIGGKKLYELARRDIIMPNIDPRDIEIFSISDFAVIQRSPAFIFKAKIKVSKGTYIRAIARDIGDMLNVFGTLEDLERTQINNFTIEDAISLEDLEQGKVTILEPFQFLDLPKVVLNDNFKRYIENGRLLDPKLFPEKTDTVIYSDNGDVLAIYYYDEKKDLMRMSVKWC